MKSAFSLVVSLLFVAASQAQVRSITADEYKGNFNGAVYATNAAFPFIFTVKTESFENGKLVRSESKVDERESEGNERIKKVFIINGKKTDVFQITAGLGNFYCSDDGVSWKPLSRHWCPGPDKILNLYSERTSGNAEYSVEQKSLEGKEVKVYRRYSVFAPSKPNGKKEYQEKVSTIDSGGFLIDLTTTEGTLDPKIITRVQTESWDTTTKFKPVVAPIK
ncbi:MAG: hypothetical protein ABI999_01840 [Acidobacteriota bacterium]